MSVEKTIAEKLLKEFAPSHLQVSNESGGHRVPKNSETHFKVTLVSDQFKGLRSVVRHQMVYRILNEELNSGVHALALHTYATEEWGGISRPSPVCHGAST